MRRRGLGTVLGLFAGVVGWILASDWLARLEGATRAARVAGVVPPWWTHSLPWQVLRSFVDSNALLGTFVGGGVAMLAIVAARAVASARIQRDEPDFLERLRADGWAHRSLNATPWVAGAATLVASRGWDTANGLAAIGVGAVAYLVARMGVRTLLAPAGAGGAAPKSADDIAFQAVPSTPRTRAVVGAFAAALLAIMAVVAVTGWEVGVYAFLATAIFVPFAFGRASRIAVGVDGVWVRDASRVRFFAYRDLDEARALGRDVALVRGGRTALRLQMHGEDAGRRDDVIARVSEGIARSRDASIRGAEMVVQTASANRVTAAASGVARYRLPSISRDQLWELVEGSTADASTRTAAARALASTLEAGDRARLRVAATQCVEPRLRVTLEELAGEADPQEDAASALRVERT